MEKVRLIVEIDKKVKNKFRVECMKDDKTMTEVLMEFITNYKNRKEVKKEE